MNSHPPEESTAVVVYTRRYASRQLLGHLSRAGFRPSELPFEHGAMRAIARLNPLLVLLVIETAHDEERQIIPRVAELTDGGVLVLAPGVQQIGFLECLRYGADACLNEADGPDRLIAEAEAIVRRVRRRDPSLPGSDRQLAVGDLEIDFRRFEVSLRDARLHLTPMEFRILAVLAENAGTVLSPMAIVAAVHEVPYTQHQARDTVKVYIRSIRQKLALADPQREYIRNARGFGYMLEIYPEDKAEQRSAAG